MTSADRFPPRPRVLRGRSDELDLLANLVRREHPTAVALVGAGGSGKSTLAAALGRTVEHDFEGGIHWFRVAAWSARTLASMLALRLGSGGGDRFARVGRGLRARGDALVVLDNHENDRAVAELLQRVDAVPVTWVLTARRCLLSGMRIHPVSPPLLTRGGTPFRSVRSLTRLLRHHPLSLSIADALVREGAVTADALGDHLRGERVDRVSVMEDEDDLPEVRLIVDWVWQRLGPAERRLLAVLAHAGGDDVDDRSLRKLARADARSLARLRAWRIVQEPFAGRFALHATVRRVVARRTKPAPRRSFEHYVGLLERAPERLDAEQTHLFAAMDWAQEHGALHDRLRVNAILERSERS